MKKLQVAVIGCGYFGNFHLENMLHMPNVEVVALCSSLEPLTQTGKTLPKARLYQDYHSLFENETLDAVVICVAPHRHFDIEMQAAKRGIHIYVEKPIAVSLAAAKETAAAIEAAGILCSVGYHERYNPELYQMKALLKDRFVGLATGSWIGGMPESAWWRTRTQSGGQIVEQTTHIFDILRYLLGEVTSVSAVASREAVAQVAECDVDGASAVQLRFASGAVAALVSGCYQNEALAADHIGFQLFTSDLTISYKWGEWGGEYVDYITKRETKRIYFEGKHHFYALSAFFKAIESGNPSGIRSPYSDGIKTLEVTLAANQSIFENRPVRIKESV